MENDNADKVHMFGKARLDKDQPPTLLLVANYPSDVGYAWWLMEEYWASLARTAQERGWRTIVAFPKVAEIPPRLREAPLEVRELVVRSQANHRAALKRFIISEHVKAVYFSDRPYRSLLYARLRLWGVESVIMHDHTPGDRVRPGFSKRMVKAGLHRLPLWTCDLYIGVSRFIHDRFIDRVCLPPERCTYVCNGIRPIGEAERQPGCVKETFGIPADALIVISSGRVSSYKRVDLIVRAAARVLTTAPTGTVYFVHCGDGPQLEEMRALVVSLGISQHFIFAGRREDVRVLLTGADIAVHASRGEAFSLAILEFMSAGLATIVPDNSGNREAVTDGRSGLVVADGDEDALVQALTTVLQHPEERSRLGRAARESADQHFTLERAKAELSQKVGAFLTDYQASTIAYS